MKFLLNNQIEITHSDFQKDSDGNFIETLKSLGIFFAEVREIKRKTKVELEIIIRKPYKLEENFKVIFKEKEYDVLSILEDVEGFLSLKCERKQL